ncbi:MAG: DUF4403 family protein [Bacteroidetes bacterium]|nr:DUF4403 family protein [Bacteroidota bacterium]
MKFKYLFLSAVCLGFLYCKTPALTNAPKPAEQYNPVQETPLSSTITIPVNISISDLVKTINTSLSGKALYEDYSYDNNGGDNFMMNAWKSRDITLNLSDQAIKYYIPLKLWMKKNLYVGEAEAEGELGLSFKTTYAIQPDWSLKTFTILEYHEWLSKPVLKTGMGNISIESIASLAINQSKTMLTKQIDQIVSQQLSLRPSVESVWSALQTPTLLSDTYKMWVKTTPTSISMTPVSSDWNTIQTKISVDCINEVLFGEKPAFRENTYLPNLKFIGPDYTADDFQIRVATDVPFPEAERLAKGFLVGQVFESGKKKVKVEDIQIWGNNDRLVVNTLLSGSFTGNIYFLGRPVFNPARNRIEMEDFDFHIDTKSMLLRSASWLFQGPMRKKIKDAMVFPLDENVKALRSEIANTLKSYPIQPGVTLSGGVDTLFVENTRITPNSIRVNLFSKGKLQVDVRGF